MTRELQSDVKSQMSNLEALEKDAESLFKGVPSPDVNSIREEVSEVKKDVEALNTSVDQHSASVVQDLEHWQDYQQELSKLRPWLEKAEIKVAMGLSRPLTLGEAEMDLEALEVFSEEVASMKDAIKEAAEKGEKMSCSNSAAEEVDALNSRWQAVKTASDHWNQKLGQLVKAWENYEKGQKEVRAWLDEKEKVIAEPFDLKSADQDVLTKRLDVITDLSKEIAQRQPKLLDLSRECDSVAASLSPEGASDLRNEVSRTRERLSDLADESRRQSNELSEAVALRQDLQGKLDGLKSWLKELTAGTNSLNEVPTERIEVGLHTCHDLSQQHEDKAALFDKTKKEVSAASPAVQASYKDLERKYLDLGQLLTAKKQALRRWSSFLSWHGESVAALKHLQQTVEGGSQQPSAEDLEAASLELDELALQCQTRKTEGSDDEQTAARSKTYVLRDGKPMSILLLVADVLQKIVKLKDLVRVKEQQAQDLEDKWEEFRQAEHRLADWLQAVLQRVQKINVKENNIDALRVASAAVAAINEECEDSISLKEKHQAIGRELMNSGDPSQVKAVEDALTEASSKWEKVAGLLKEQHVKSQTLLTMWESCQEQHAAISGQLEAADDILEAVKSPLVAGSASEAATLADKCRSGLDGVKRLRHPFEAYYKRQTQLVQELSTVPGFDVSPLKGELQSVQQKFSFLGVSLKGKMSEFERQLVLWRQLEQSKDEMLSWVNEAEAGMADALKNVSDAEVARVKLNKYKHELPAYANIKNGIDQKIDQLRNANPNEDVPELDDIEVHLDQRLQKAEETAKQLEKAIGHVGDSAKEVRDDIKQATDCLAKIREQVAKCDDMSGSDKEIFDRLETARELQGEVESFDDKLLAIERKIDAIREHYKTADTSALTKELGNLEKRVEALHSNASKTCGSLYGILEKHYVERLREEMKMLASCRDKVTWCKPDPSSDKFNLESKLDTVDDVIDQLTDKKSTMGSLHESAKLMLKAVEPEKAIEIEESIDSIGKEKLALLEEAQTIKADLDRLLNLHKQYEKQAENMSLLLKDQEEALRKERSQPVEISNFKEASNRLKHMESVLTEKKPVIEEIAQLSTEISQKTPDSRIPQQAHQLAKRLETAKAAVAEQIKKLDKVFESKDAQSDAINAYEKWLADSKTKLKPFEELGKTKASKAIPIAKLEELRDLMSDRNEGHRLLEAAIESGENLFAYIASSDRDRIRGHIRMMRDGWEGHIDYMNGIQKDVEAVAMKWTSFEENYDQVSKWLNSTKAALDKGEKVGCATLSEKKVCVHDAKVLQQDILSHAAIVANLTDKAKSLGSADAAKVMADCNSEYDAVKHRANKQLDNAKVMLANHENYENLLNKCKDAIGVAEKELELLMIAPTEENDSPKKIEDVDNLLSANNSIEKDLSVCLRQQPLVLEHTSRDGQEVVKEELEDASNSWMNLMKRASNYKEQLQSLSGHAEEVKREVQDFADWLSAKELLIKDHTMKRDTDAKKKYAQLLREVSRDVSSKHDAQQKLTQETAALGQESDLLASMSQLSNRYNLLGKNVKEMQAKYEVFVKEHSSFDAQHREFLVWIKNVSEDAIRCGEPVGDLKVLQERRGSIEELEDLRTSEAAKFDSLLELGERLYSHTSPDGKEIVREQLAALRSSWDQLSEDLQAATGRLDACLQQFSDFSALQERLTRWLRDIETAMQEHTEPRATLEEKKGQLQNHRTIHQEITAHNSLVDAVCAKAQELVDETRDRSLDIYIESIRALFKNIGLKSKDLMDKLGSCVKEHTHYVGMMKAFTEFLGTQGDLLAQCADVSGEKSDLDRKMLILNELKNSKIAGDAKLGELEAQCSVVCKGTSAKGSQRLQQELQEVKDSWDTHSALIDDVEINVEKADAQWKQFNEDVRKHADWFKHYEGVFREQILQPGLEEKRQCLSELNAKRSDVIAYEKTVDDFVNNAHALLQNTGAEHLRPAVTQISNRYQLLHVLSKEVSAKRQGMVEEHENYTVKLDDAKKWLKGLEDKIDKASAENDSEVKSELLQSVIAEQEHAPAKVHALTALGERLFADTSSDGRDRIRRELREVSGRWDEVLQAAEGLQHRQNAEAQAWDAYKQNLAHAVQWLDGAEAASATPAAAAPGINWLSIQETRQRLLKLKSDLSDAESHRRIIDSVNESGASVLRANPHTDPTEMQADIDKVNERYADLLEKMRSDVTDVEACAECVQGYRDLQRNHQVRLHCRFW